MSRVRLGASSETCHDACLAENRDTVEICTRSALSVVISHSGTTVGRGLPSVSPQTVLGHPNLVGCVSLPSFTAVPRLALRRSLRSHVLVVNAILRQCMWVCVPRFWIEAPCVLLVHAWSETEALGSAPQAEQGY